MFAIGNPDLHSQPESHTVTSTQEARFPTFTSSTRSWLCPECCSAWHTVLCPSLHHTAAHFCLLSLWCLPLSLLPSKASPLLNAIALSLSPSAQGGMWFSTYHFLIILRVSILPLSIRGRKSLHQGELALRALLAPWKAASCWTLWKRKNFMNKWVGHGQTYRNLTFT